MHFHRPSGRITCLAALLVCLGLVGCKHVEFERGTSPVEPSVVPGSGNRFKLNFTVINPTDNEYPYGTFRVDASVNYTGTGGPIHKDFDWTIGHMPAKTGKISVINFPFDPQVFAGDGSPCQKNSCSGGILLTLRWNSGPDAGKKVKGGNTKLNIAWDKSGDPSKIVITDHGG